MIAFPGMLAGAAKEAGIEHPTDPDDLNYEVNEYPYWHVFVTLQCGASMPSPTSHWSNARVIASIPKDKIMTITADEVFTMGFEVGQPVP